MNHVDEKFTDYQFELNDENEDDHIQNESNVNDIYRTYIVNENFLSIKNNNLDNNQSQRNYISTSLTNYEEEFPIDTNGYIEDYITGKTFTNEKLNTRLEYLDNFKVQIKLLKILNDKGVSKNIFDLIMAWMKKFLFKINH